MLPCTGRASWSCFSCACSRMALHRMDPSWPAPEYVALCICCPHDIAAAGTAKGGQLVHATGGSDARSHVGGLKGLLDERVRPLLLGARGHEGTVAHGVMVVRLQCKIPTNI